MNLRSVFLIGTLAALSLITPAFAAPPPAVTPQADTPAVAVVREFLADRAAGKYDAAYALLSANAKQVLPFKEFIAGDSSPLGADPSLPAAFLGIGNLFADTHNRRGYTFTVISPDPSDPKVVLVQAVQPKTPALTLRLLTVTEPATLMPRLDLLGSLERTAPEEFVRARVRAQRDSSQSNLKQLALGVIQYTQDHDERMPDAATWVDEIMPYVKTEAIFHDPSAPAGEKWSYAYNRTLSHQPLAALDSPAQTIMLFESTAGVKNASDTGQSVPVPGRHLGGTDYAQADGHVKWVKDGAKLSFKLTGQ